MGTPSWIFTECFLFGIIILFAIAAACRDQEVHVTKVNILLINEDPRAEDLFNHALKHMEQNQDSIRIEIGVVHHLDYKILPSVNIARNFCMYLERFMTSEHPPDIALDFTRNITISGTVKKLLRAIRMPTIAGTFDKGLSEREWRDLTTSEIEYLIQVSPPVDMLLQAAASFVEYQDMTSAVVLFDEQRADEDKYKALVESLPPRHLFIPLEFENLTGQIENLVHLDIYNYFIFSSPNAISEALARASSPNALDGPYFNIEYAWYSMSMEEGLPRCTGCEVPVTLIHLSPEPVKESKQKDFLQARLGGNFPTFTQMFYFDVTLAAVKAVAQLKRAGEWNHDISKNTCVNWNSATNMIHPDISVTLFQAFQTATDDSILTYYFDHDSTNHPEFGMKIQRLTFDRNADTPKKTENIGTWRAGLGEDELIDFEDHEALIQHRVLSVYRVVVVVQEPFVFKRPNCTASREKHCFRGICIDLLDKLADEMGFSYTIREVESGYGFMDLKNPPEWDGMVRELMDRNADIAIGAMSVMSEREEVIDFTIPFYDLVGISILMRKREDPTSLFKYLTVFGNDVWLTIFAMFLFTSILMWTYDYFSPFSYRNNSAKYEDAHEDEKRIFSLTESFWFCVTSMTPQGGGEAPKNLSGRIVVFTWWFFVFVLLASFGANLAAVLTVDGRGHGIESLDDLSKQYRVQYAPLVNTSTWAYFLRMADIEKKLEEMWIRMIVNESIDEYESSKFELHNHPLKQKYKHIWKEILDNNPPKTREQAMDRLRGFNPSNPKSELDDFAFLDEATNVKWQTTINCDFEEIGEEFSRKPYAIAVQKGSPLKEAISYKILEYQNNRYLEQLKETWWNTEKKMCSLEDHLEAVSIHNLGGIFIVILAGLGVCFFILLLECWWDRKKRSVIKATLSEPVTQQQESIASVSGPSNATPNPTRMINVKPVKANAKATEAVTKPRPTKESLNADLRACREHLEEPWNDLRTLGKS